MAACMCATGVVNIRLSGYHIETFKNQESIKEKIILCEADCCTNHTHVHMGAVGKQGNKKGKVLGLHHDDG
jgi:hypothetical protein